MENNNEVNIGRYVAMCVYDAIISNVACVPKFNWSLFGFIMPLKYSKTDCGSQCQLKHATLDTIVRVLLGIYEHVYVCMYIALFQFHAFKIHTLIPKNRFRTFFSNFSIAFFIDFSYLRYLKMYNIIFCYIQYGIYINILIIILNF